MDKFDLIGQLNRATLAKDWHFIYGNNFYINYEASQKKYFPNDLVLTADFTSQPTIKNALVTEIRYNGIIMLGEKENDSGYKASLDETMQQKYNRRLLRLMTLLTDFIGQFACDNELDITVNNFRVDINRFDTNIDFVVMELTLIQ